MYPYRILAAHHRSGTTPAAEPPVSDETSSMAGIPRLTGRELGGIAALLAALLLLFFLTPILRQERLSPADLLLKSPPWRQGTVPAFEPANALLSDYVYVFRPWREFAMASLRTGQIPLWNPYNYAGAPFLGNGQSAVLYPLNFLYLVLPDATALLLGAMTRLFIAGFSTYVFARLIGLRPLGATVTSVGFTFSGTLVVWLLYPLANVAIWLPALFLAGEAIVRRPSAPRVVAMGVIVAVQFLGGHAETSLHILAAVGLYVAWRLAMLFRAERDWRSVARRLGAFAGALALGTGGAAVQLLPLAEYVLESFTLHERLAWVPSPWAVRIPNVLAMVALACPYCFGSSLGGDLPLGPVLRIGNFNELNGGYVGLLALLLAGLAIALGARRGLDRFFIVLAGLAFCTAYAIPPVFNAVHALPLFRVSVNARTLLLLAFALCVLAGRGTDLLTGTLDARARGILTWGRKVLVAAMVGVAVLTAGLLITVMSFREQILEWAKARIAARTWDPAGSERLLGLLPHYHDRLVSLLLKQGSGRLALLALSGLAIAVAVRSARGRRAYAWVLPGVLLLDLFSFGRNYNPSLPTPVEYPLHPAIEFVQAQPGLFRVLTLNGGLPPNTNMMYGLFAVRGYDALETKAYHRFLAATGDYRRPHGAIRTLYFSNFESPLIDLLNVKYVISDLALRHPKLTRVWEGSGAYVYENRSALERAFLVYRTRVLSDARDMDRALRAPEFDPRTVVLLEGQEPAFTGPGDPAATVRVTDYQPARVAVEVSSCCEAVLILADAWFPGWRATVDGRPEPILPGNLLLRAVPVPAGYHRVLFWYDPLSFRLGLLTSALAVAVAVSLGLAGLWRRRDGRRNAPGVLSGRGTARGTTAP